MLKWCDLCRSYEARNSTRLGNGLCGRGSAGVEIGFAGSTCILIAVAIDTLRAMRNL